MSERPARAAYPTSGGQGDVWQLVAKVPLHSGDALALRGFYYGLRGILSQSGRYVRHLHLGVGILGVDSARCHGRYAPWAQRYTSARTGFLRTMTHTDGGEGRVIIP